MCADRKSFAEFEECNKGVVRMVNGIASKIVGKGQSGFLCQTEGG